MNAKKSTNNKQITPHRNITSDTLQTCPLIDSAAVPPYNSTPACTVQPISKENRIEMVIRVDIRIVNAKKSWVFFQIKMFFRGT